MDVQEIFWTSKKSFGRRTVSDVQKIINNFGGNLKAFVSGGGPLDKNVGIFLNSLGLKTLQGYGLTETSPVVSCNPVNKIKIAK